MSKLIGIVLIAGFILLFWASIVGFMNWTRIGNDGTNKHVDKIIHRYSIIHRHADGLPNSYYETNIFHEYQGFVSFIDQNGQSVDLSGDLTISPLENKFH